MMRRIGRRRTVGVVAAAWLLALSSLTAPRDAQADAKAGPPPAVQALAGCWQGTGAVGNKPVTVTIRVAPVAGGAMMAFDVDSHAVADSADVYAAHLLFGTGDAADAVVGYWADSFGGAFARSGEGAVVPGGFDIGYDYGDAVYVNRWRREGRALRWTIVERRKTAPGDDTLFAHYALRPAPCPADPAA